MNPDFHRMMQEAARLTREGRLHAATAAIQAALAGSALATPAPADAADADVIDVEVREVTPRDGAPARARMSAHAAEAPTARPAVDEARFVDGSFGAGAARRDYKLYIPPGADAQPRPLVVMLHGCTQDPADFAAGTGMNEAAALQGCYVLYPGQSAQANPQRCWNWFKHNHQTRDRGEAGTIAGMTQDVMARHAIDPARVYVAGLSAGGAMAAILADAYPDLYAAVGVHSGLAAGSAQNLPGALGAMKDGGAARRANGVPTIVFHGDADRTVNVANGERVIAGSVGATAPSETQQVRGQRGGRSATRHLYRDAGGGVVAEYWLVDGAPHAWSGGRAAGSYTDESGPDASGEMLRFFLEHPHRRG